MTTLGRQTEIRTNARFLDSNKYLLLDLGRGIDGRGGEAEEQREVAHYISNA